MSWIVTYDHTEERPVLMNKPADARVLPKYKYAFRLFDDDNNLCFSGLATSRDDEAAFEPLDYLMNAYGCTEIQYQQDDLTWKVL